MGVAPQRFDVFLAVRDLTDVTRRSRHIFEMWKRKKPEQKRVNKRGGDMVTRVWANTKNAKKNIGKIVKTQTPFLARYGHPWTQKTFENGQFPRRIVFLRSHVLPTFSDMVSCSKRPNMLFFTGGLYPKVQIMRWKKS